MTAMNAKQIFLWYLLGVIIAQILFYKQLSTAFDEWRMKGCEHVLDIEAYELAVNPANGDLWGVSHDSLFQFDGMERHNYKVASHQSGYAGESFIVFDPQGRTWQGGWNGVSVFDGRSWKSYNEQDWGLPDTIVTSIAFDPSGKPWVGLSANGSSPEGTCGGVSILKDERWMTYHFSNASRVETGCQHVHSIQFDSSGRAWLGLSTGVLMILEKVQDETAQNALPGGPVFSSTFHSTGYFLIPEESLPGKDDTGPVVIKDFLARSHANQLTVDGFILDSIRSILFDKRGNTWINAGGKLYQVRDDTAILARPSSGRSVMDRQGNIWSIGQQGVSMYDGKVWRTYRAGNSCIGNGDVRAMTFDKDNRAWVSQAPIYGGEFSLGTFDEPPHRVSDVILRLRAIFLPGQNYWFRWVGPILLGGAWLLIAVGAKWPAFIFPLLNMVLALVSERIQQGQYQPMFVFELLTIFSLGAGLIDGWINRQQGKAGFWKNVAPGFHGTLIGILFILIAGLLWILYNE